MLDHGVVTNDMVLLDELSYLPFSDSGGALMFHLLNLNVEIDANLLIFMKFWFHQLHLPHKKKGCSGTSSTNCKRIHLGTRLSEL